MDGLEKIVSGGVGRGSLENFWGRGSLGQLFFLGPGRGGAGRASLLATFGHLKAIEENRHKVPKSA